VRADRMTLRDVYQSVTENKANFWPPRDEVAAGAVESAQNINEFFATRHRREAEKALPSTISIAAPSREGPVRYSASGRSAVAARGRGGANAPLVPGRSTNGKIALIRGTRGHLNSPRRKSLLLVAQVPCACQQRISAFFDRAGPFSSLRICADNCLQTVRFGEASQALDPPVLRKKFDSGL